MIYEISIAKWSFFAAAAQERETIGYANRRIEFDDASNVSMTYTYKCMYKRSFRTVYT